MRLGVMSSSRRPCIDRLPDFMPGVDPGTIPGVKVSPELSIMSAIAGTTGIRLSRGKTEVIWLIINAPTARSFSRLIFLSIRVRSKYRITRQCLVCNVAICVGALH